MNVIEFIHRRLLGIVTQISQDARPSPLCTLSPNMANPYPSSPNSKFSPSSLEPFDLTHVLHNPSEPLDVLFALSALLPIFLIVAYVTMIISRREIAICVALVGQLMNEAGNAVVKRWFKQARPYREFLGEDCGRRLGTRIDVIRHLEILG